MTFLKVTNHLSVFFNQNIHFKSALVSLLVLQLYPTLAFGVPIQWSSAIGGNDHYYEYVADTTIIWTNAKTAAEGMFHLGLQGYLATITSAEENDFVFNSVGKFHNSWIGASDAATEGEWRWVTGPEAGTLFWKDGVTITYANWYSGEPNNFSGLEHDADMLGGSGKWNDLSGTDTSTVQGYIVEYGGLEGVLEEPIPVPSTLILFGSGLAGMGFVRRRRRVA